MTFKFSMSHFNIQQGRDNYLEDDCGQYKVSCTGGELCIKILPRVVYSDIQHMYMSHRVGKPTIYIGENKRRICFRYTDSTIHLLSKSKIYSL